MEGGGGALERIDSKIVYRVLVIYLSNKTKEHPSMSKESAKDTLYKILE